MRNFISRVLLLTCFLYPTIALAITSAKTAEEKVEIIEHLGQTVSLDLVFTDQNGKTQALKDFLIENRPTILTPVYYRCPSLCSQTLNGVRKALDEIELELGTDFNVISLSFNHKENWELASKKAKNYIESLEEPNKAEGNWHFLVGSEENVNKLMKEVGFGFVEDLDDFLHSAIIVLLSPEGKITRYFYGITYPEKQLRLSLIEAAKGKIGSTFDRVLLYCFRFDPSRGKYTLAILSLTKVVSLVIVLALFGGLITLRIKEVRQKKDA